MPIRFPTEAANADSIGDLDGTSERKPRDAAEARFWRSRETYRPNADVKPGKDINAPGFIKPRDGDDGPSR